MKVLSNHLRHAGLSPSQQRNIFSQMVLESPMLTDALHRLQELGGKASEFWLVSGALYNTIWNRLTGRPNLHGIKDLDIIYSTAAIFPGRRRMRLSRAALKSFAIFRFQSRYAIRHGCICGSKNDSESLIRRFFPRPNR
jgi:hypothetical protein